MPQEIVRLANSYMKLPIRVEIARAGTVSDNVTQEIFFLRKEDKTRLLEKLLSEYKGTVLVFSRTKHGAKRISQMIRGMGHTSAELHSNRTLAQRRAALEGFKIGRIRVLVATDIAARGIDVQGIELVLNFDLPDQAEDYVHRIGRTGRASHHGHAVSFATPDQRNDVRGIERLLRMNLPVATVPELPPMRALPPRTEDYEEERGSRFASRRPYDPRQPRQMSPSRGGASAGPRSQGAHGPRGPQAGGRGQSTRRAPRVSW